MPLIDIREHGGIFGGGNKKLEDLFKNVPNKNTFGVVQFGTIANALSNSGIFNGVSKKIEQNVSVRATQPFSTLDSPAIIISIHDNHIDTAPTTFSRTFTELYGNCPVSNSRFFAYPLDTSKRLYFIYADATWATPTKTAKGVWDLTTGRFTSWGTDDYLLASEVAGYYYKYNPVTKILTKYRSSDNQLIYTVNNITLLAGYGGYVYTENNNYIYFAVALHHTWQNFSVSTNQTIIVYRLEKTTGNITQFLTINNVCYNFRMFATDTKLLVYRGNYQVMTSPEPLYIYDANTGTLLMTTASLGWSVPIMYYPEKDYMLLRELYIPNKTAICRYKIFDIQANSVKYTTTMYEMSTEYGGAGGSQYYGQVHSNESFTVMWEHSKRYLLNKKEYFSFVGSLCASSYVPYTLFDFIIN